MEWNYLSIPNFNYVATDTVLTTNSYTIVHNCIPFGLFEGVFIDEITSPQITDEI